MQLYSSTMPIGVMAATILELNFDRRLEVVTAGLPGEFSGLLQNKISREDALTIIDYREKKAIIVVGSCTLVKYIQMSRGCQGR